jgi:sec-independent protein translocase protein TatA
MGLENPTHWIPIVVILLLIFGAKRLPEIGRSLGSGMREFKQSVTGQSEPEQLNPAPQQTATPPAQAAQAPPAPTPPAAAPPPAAEPSQQA